MNATPVFQISEAIVAEWRQERSAHLLEIVRLQDLVADLDRKIEAAKVFLPSLAGSSAGADGGADDVTNWPELVRWALSRANGGRTQRYIMEMGKETPLADRLKSHNNGLYNAVARLVGRGEVIRENDLLYLPHLWHAIQAGQTEDIPEPTNGPPSLRSSILELMADGRLRAAGEIFASLTGRAGEQVKNRPQYGYTILSRMSQTGDLERRDGMYRISRSKDGVLPMD